jgi:CheY-like chemotaxis protein
MLARGLAVIERNARIQAQLVSDLLDVSRIVSGKLTLELGLADVSDVVEAAIETMKPTADAKGVRLEGVVDRTIHPLVGDPARLQQVVWNLVSNGVKFTPTGGLVRVTAAQADGLVTITVTDTGAGIPPDFVSHVFERFRQADASTSRRFGGLGLGLTIVKQLVELHGGTITAHSEGEGRGASFVVTLPTDTGPSGDGAADRTEAKPAPLAGGAGTIAAVLQGLRVLIVEDEADARELIERLLSEAGCQITAVGSAREALEALAASAPDLLVSDIGLPSADGYTLIQQIRESAREEIAGMPAIALTAFVRSEDRNRALRSGFQAHLSKPLDPAEFIATVASFASLSRSRRTE